MKKLNNFILSICFISLVGCGGGSSNHSTETSNNIPNDNSNQNNIENDKEQEDTKEYKFSDFFEVIGNEYTYSVLRLKFNPNIISNIRLTFKEKPNDSSPWFSYDSWKSEYNQYRISFDKAGDYVVTINFYDVKTQKYLTKDISINIKDSNLISTSMLKEDLVLDDTSKPYALQSGISIPYNVKLTVNPGVTINGNNKGINVEGILELNGTKEKPVYLSDSSISPVGNRSSNATIKINHAVLIGTNPYASIGGRIAGTLDLLDSKLYDFDSEIYLWFPAGPINIKRNYFHKAGGIHWESSDYLINIQNNKFEDWTTQSAIYANTAVNISGNTFIKPQRNDRYAIYFRGFYMPTGSDLMVTNNYWGTLDEDAIKSMIMDRNSTVESSGYAIYKPYLTIPDSKTPQ